MLGPLTLMFFLSGANYLGQWLYTLESWDMLLQNVWKWVCFCRLAGQMKKLLFEPNQYHPSVYTKEIWYVCNFVTCAIFYLCKKDEEVQNQWGEWVLTNIILLFTQKRFGIYVTLLHMQFFIYAKKMRQIKIGEEREHCFYIHRTDQTVYIHNCFLILTLGTSRCV